jgi:SNF2 family DNA or RNA helicase
MGLGKTVMMTALIVSNPPNQGYMTSENACTLVIVPLTLLSQW